MFLLDLSLEHLQTKCVILYYQYNLETLNTFENKNKWPIIVSFMAFQAILGFTSKCIHRKIAAFML